MEEIWETGRNNEKPENVWRASSRFSTGLSQKYCRIKRNETYDGICEEERMSGAVGVRMIHHEKCLFIKAATCAVPIECNHGFDVCPVCDPCFCDTPLDNGPHTAYTSIQPKQGTIWTPRMQNEMDREISCPRSAKPVEPLDGCRGVSGSSIVSGFIGQWRSRRPSRYRNMKTLDRALNIVLTISCFGYIIAEGALAKRKKQQTTDSKQINELFDDLFLLSNAIIYGANSGGTVKFKEFEFQEFKDWWLRQRGYKVWIQVDNSCMLRWHFGFSPVSYISLMCGQWRKPIMLCWWRWAVW